jgi:hypothetical protein
VVAAVLGLTLVGLALLALLVNRLLWGRRIGAPLVVALLVTLALTAASITIFQLGDGRLRAGHDDVTSFLAQEQAGGTAYDVAADPARYLITGKDDEWSTDATNAERQIRGSVSGEAWIEWDVYDNTLTGLFAGIDDGRIVPADVSLYNADAGAGQEFGTFRRFLLASGSTLISTAAQRLPAARSLYTVWFFIPIAAMVILLYLADQVVGRRRGSHGSGATGEAGVASSP